MVIKIAQLREKAEAELREELSKCESQLRTLRFEASFKKLKNVKALLEAKKLRARILTLLKEKQVV